MTKAELVAFMAEKAGIAKTKAAEALEAFEKAVSGSLKKGNKVTLVGFGTFAAKRRPARTGRNPLNGAAVKIPARNVVSFKAGIQLKEAIN